MDRFVIRKREASPINDGSPTKKFFDCENLTLRQMLDKQSENSFNDSNTSTSDYAVAFPKYLYKGIDLRFEKLKSIKQTWKKIRRENLDLDYVILFSRDDADRLFDIFEDELEYFTGHLAKIQVFGKWHNIPRKQVTYGDPGLTYRYSGIVTPAKPWPKALEAIRDLLAHTTGYHYNFVLVNRYNDGNDKMGEHKDDEKELDPNTPIASISLGQHRDFYFKHQDARGTKKVKIDKVSMELEHGSLLLMNAPTNTFWYHALPARKSQMGVRINLTFRRIVQ